MLENNIITPSTSAWFSPVILVRKQCGTYRFAVDYRKLNKITKPTPLSTCAMTIEKDAGEFENPNGNLIHSYIPD
jgi:hypothetical protein